MKNLMAVMIMVISILASMASQALADSKVVLVNGENPEVYFQRFLYHTSGSCHAETGIWFHFVETFDYSLKLPDANDGRRRRANFALYLSENGEYAADLTEEIFYEKNGDIETFRVVSKKRINGKWNISDDGKLVIQEVGVASALIYNGNPAMDFKIDSDFQENDLRDQSVILVNVVGSGGRDPFDQVCR